MDLKFLLHVLIFITSAELHSIQVYENVEDTPISYYDNIRHLRPNRDQRPYFMGIAQQDKLKWRYFEQQKVDALNRAKNKVLFRKKKIPAHNLSNLRKRDVSFFQKNFASPDVVYRPETVQTINLGLNHEENLRLLRQNIQGINQQEQEFQTFNDLIGKSPTIQLQDLQQIVRPKEYTPIMEDVIDYANPQKQPNIKVEPAAYELQAAVAQEHVLRAEAQQKLKQLEEEFRAAAHTKVQKVIAQAHQAALAEVEAKQRAKDEVTKEAAAVIAAATETAHLPTKASLFHINPVIMHQHKDDNDDRDGLNVHYASQYAYGYRVRDYHSGNDFGHEQIHDGHITKGNYHVLLPDGRLQRVQYWADKTGFHAKVAYDRIAHHHIDAI